MALPIAPLKETTLTHAPNYGTPPNGNLYRFAQAWRQLHASNFGFA
jgi:hypothetical protein